MSPQPQLTVHDLKRIRENDEPHFLVDVRKPEERDIASIGGHLIPLDQLASRVGEIEEHRDEKIIVYCRSGGRSARAVDFLRSMGLDAHNLAGGILAWSREIDPDVATY